MATISITNELDVLNKYESLVKQSLGTDSLYIRAKETIQELAENGEIKNTDKAAIISEVIASITNGVTSASMSTALQWATNEKDVALRKLELEKQLDILQYDGELRQAQVKQMGYENIALQAETRRMHGVPTVVDGTVTSLSNDGKLYYETEVLKAQDINLDKQGALLDSQLNESYAAIHKVVADTYTNYGSCTFSLNDTGVVSVTDTTDPAWERQADIQKQIGKEQANGYAYNAWANALSGSASMLGTAMASEYDPFGGGGTGDQLLNTVVSVADKLNTNPVTPY